MAFAQRMTIVIGVLLLASVGFADKPENPGKPDKPPRPGQPGGCVVTPGGLCPTDVGTAVAACCQCDSSGNHGEYVGCVGHAVNTLLRAGCLDRQTKKSLKRCAARSTCGKPGFVTCNIPRYGTCDLATSTCSEGTSTQLDGLCDTDTDCVTEVKCKIKSSADRCTAIGGTVGTGTSCCPDCAAGG
jgi:hypothetical protein